MQSKGIQVVSGVKYRVVDLSRIREYILAMADKEWDPEDFVRFGKDLRRSTWELEKVNVGSVRMRTELICSRGFQNDLRPRIASQLKAIQAGRSILPLVLRGKDLLIFDGYARLYALQQLEIDECLAYVGRIKPGGILQRDSSRKG